MPAALTANAVAIAAGPESIVRAARAAVFSRVEIFARVDAASAAWHQLERVAPCTPYQRWAWAEAWCATVGAAERATPMIVVAYDDEDRPVALLPLIRVEQAGLRVAQFLGGKDSNGNLGLFAEPAIWGDEAVHRLLNVAGKEAGVDLFVLQNQPGSWDGATNPMLALAHQESPNQVLTASLAAGSANHLSKHARKLLRQKETRLAALGRVEHRRAGTAADIEHTLAAHAAQRASRTDVTGVAPPSDAQLAFYRRAATAGAEAAALEMYALWCGDEIVATFGGTGYRGRYSGMILAMDSRPEIARCSPGELLLRRILPELVQRGFDQFDLGLGDARYKRGFCDQPEPMFDAFQAVTFRGRIASLGFRGALSAKRRIKGSASAMARVRQIRSRLLQRTRERLSRP